MELIDSYGTENYDSYFQELENGTAPWTKAVSMGMHGNGKTLKTIKWYLRKYGSPTGNIYCKLFNETGTFGWSGKPDDSPPYSNYLAISDAVDVSSIPNSFPSDPTLVTFTFSSPYTLTDGGHYSLVIEYLSGDDSNSVHVGGDSSSSFYTVGNQGRWQEVTGFETTPGRAHIFYAYSDEATVDYSTKRIAQCG